MKVIILFALASVGVCTEPPEECLACEPYVRTFDQCDDFVNIYADDENCLIHAFKSLPQMLEIAKKLMCKHRRNELDKRFVYYTEFEEEMRDFMGCIGCFAGMAIGVEEILGNIGAALGTLLGIATKLTGELIHSTGAFEIVLDFLCALLTGELASESVELLSRSDLMSWADSLENLFCMAKKETLDVLLTVELLRRAGFLQKKFLGLEDELKNLPVEVVQTLASFLKHLLNEILGAPGVDDIVGEVTCLAWDILGGFTG